MSQRLAAAERLRTSCAGSARFRSAKEPAGGTQRERGLVFLGPSKTSCLRTSGGALPWELCPASVLGERRPFRARLCQYQFGHDSLGSGNTSQAPWASTASRTSWAIDKTELARRALSLSLSPSLTLEASTARSCPWNERRFLFGEAGVKKDIMLSTKGWTPSLVAIRGGLHPRKNVK